MGSEGSGAVSVERIAAVLEKCMSLAEQLVELEKRKVARPPLKPRERAAILAIKAGRLVAKQIAKEMEVECTKSFQGFLADMVRFGRLENNGDGYAVMPAYRDVLQEPEDDGAEE